MGLRDIGAELPPGFRFYPSDEELVCHYLLKKISKEETLKGTLVEIDLHTCEPWQLPEVAKLNSTDWYFFSFRDRKYATGFRANRATKSGYWKATGKDREVVDPRTNTIAGMRKTLVFYKNRAPNGVKTGWIMHEFRLENPRIPPKEDWVLCRVFHKTKTTENNDQLSPQDMFEIQSAGDISPLDPASNGNLPFGSYNYQINSQLCPHPDNHSSINPYFLQLSHQVHMENSAALPGLSDMMNSKCEDQQYDYENLFDMKHFEEKNLGEGLYTYSYMEDMDIRFDYL